MAVADRAFVLIPIALGTTRPLFHQNAHHLWDHIAGALDDHAVAFAHIEPLNLVFVMERRVLDDDAANVYGLEPRHWRQLAGTANLDVDFFENGFRLFRREFVRDGPARRPGDKPKTLLQFEIIDFVDDAIDVVAKISALAFDVAIKRQDLIGGPATLRQRIDAQAP